MKLHFLNKNQINQNNAFDNLGLDDDLLDDSLLREGSDFNITEKLGLLKPEKDIPQEKGEISLKEENDNLKQIISQMKDEMVKIAQQQESVPKTLQNIQEKSSNELAFYMNTNKRLLAQLDSEKEKFEIIEKELDIKQREMEIGMKLLIWN